MKPPANNKNNTISQPIIAESYANINITILGFICVPLWLILLLHEHVKGYSFLESLTITAQSLFQSSAFLIVLAFFEALIGLSYLRLSHQKLSLTEESLFLQSGLFTPKIQVLPLSEIKSIYIQTDKSIWAKKMNFTTIVIEPFSDDKKVFNTMKNAALFVDKASWKIATQRKKD